MFNRKLKIFLLLIVQCLFYPGIYVHGNGSVILKKNSGQDSSIATQRLIIETDNPEIADQIISDHMHEIFPIISDFEINQIVLSKNVSNIKSDTSLTSASENQYRITFDVPVNFLADTAKILWELNIPSFESKLFQLYHNREIYIDTWPNVVGRITDKTYTGNFQAYKIRNWPFYKDPDPKLAAQPPTKPGPGNPLGLFVVHYDENSLRYFHGTNKNGLLKNKMRNLSHGCVRNDNTNIEKMKEFIIKRVVKSTDLSNWLGSKRTMVYNFEEQDKFPVRITYRTFEMGKDFNGSYIILYSDIYKYSKGAPVNEEWNDVSLITLTTGENLINEYRKTFGKDIPDEALKVIADYLVNNGEEYEKYYVEDLKKKFMLH